MAKRSVKTTPKTGPTEERIRIVAKNVDAGFRKFLPDLVVIERAYNSPGASTAVLFELAGVIKQTLWRYQAPWHTIPPNTVKAFAGHGHASKDQMIEWAQREWPGCPHDDNLADAYFLARYGFEKYDEIVS